MPELLLNISTAKLAPSPTNPRKHLGDPAKLAELAASIKEVGVLEPIIVREPKRGEVYELVFGHRRLEAAKMAEREDVPCIVRTYTDEQVLDIQIIENSQREDVHPLDEADAFAAAVKRGRTVAHIAEKIGRPASFVALRLQLLKLSKDGRAALDAGSITLAVAQMLARIPDPDLQRDALDDIRNGSHDDPMTADEVRKLLEERYMLRLADAPFDVTDAKLVAKAGACTTCPKRTGHQRELFADVKSPDLCTDQKCFDTKKDAVFQIKLKEAKTSGQEVLEGKAAEKALSYGSAYRKLNETEWIGQKRKTIREITAKAKPPVTLAKGRDGEIHELVRTADVAKCLPKARAPKQDASMLKYEAETKQRAAKERRRKKAVQYAIGAAVTKAGKLAPGDLLDLVVRAFAARAWNEVQKAVLERRGIKPKAGGVEQQLLKLIKDAKTTAEVHGFAIELALGSGQLGYGSSAQMWSEGLKLVGLEFSTFEKQVAAEEKAKAPKKKAAAKKATAKKAPKRKGQKS